MTRKSLPNKSAQNLSKDNRRKMYLKFGYTFYIRGIKKN